MTRTPLFSIVIPTYNRSELVQGAVRSILAQTLNDFEVVVSDNCSEDDTREVIERFQDPRVRYVRTPVHGPIGESWEFARSQAKGALIMMLSDDDALVHDALERFAEAHRRYDADFLFCNLAEYRDRTFAGPDKNTVRCRPFSAETRKVSTDEFVGPLMAFKPAFDMHPSAFMFHADLADQVVRRSGRFFRTNGVEYYAWPIAAVLSKRIAYIDWPLVVLGRTAKSWGSNVVLSNPGKEQIEKMIADVEHKRDWLPLTNFTLSNLMAEGMLLGKQLFPEELRPYPFDEERYLRSTMKELRNRRAMGVDVDRDLGELLEYAGKYPALKAELLGLSGNGTTAQVSTIRKVAQALRLNRVHRRLQVVRQARKFKEGAARAGFVVSGGDFGFNDALGCANFLSKVAALAADSKSSSTTVTPAAVPLSQG